MKYSALYLLMAFAAVVSFTSCSDELNLPDGTWTANAKNPGPIPPPPPPPIKEYVVNGVKFKMMLVEAGTFNMGPSGAKHTVTLTKDYYIGETEVTQALWNAVMSETSASNGLAWNTTYKMGDNHPAYNISWEDCQTFIIKLNQLMGQRFRLPTEAEWEFAAHGGNKSKGFTYSGSNNLPTVGWYDNNSINLGHEHPDYGTHAVKSKLPNELDIYDMSGNVFEWCSDLYSASSATNYRVRRGGSWISLPMACEVSCRNSGPHDTRTFDNGLRLALSE